MISFSLKSLTFYSVTIGLVSLLFNVITAYGNTNLKAPPPIDGSYSLEGKIPGCLKSPAVKLVVMQSGIYLNAAIVSTSSDADTPNPRREKPTLLGRFQNGEISLSGSIPILPNCETPVPNSLNITGRIAKDILQGQIQLNGQSIPFQSQRQKPPMENSH